MQKEIKIIKDWLYVKTILISSSILITSIFSIFYFVGALNGFEKLIVIAPIVFFGIIFILVRIMYGKQKKQEIHLANDKIIIYKNKKQYIFQWKDLASSSIEKLTFGTDSLIMEFLTHAILKWFYVNYKMIFNTEQDLREVEFNISKAQVKKINEKQLHN